MNPDAADNLGRVRARIAAACSRSNRRAEEVELIAVSKTHPAEAIENIIAAGCRRFGENKVQEAEAKILSVGRQNAEWHLIGHLQSNKARKAVRLFDVIHSLDSIELADRLERVCFEEERVELRVFVQVDLALESTKNGIAETRLPKLVTFLDECERLKFSGLMTLPPFSEDPENARPYFRRLREIGEDLKSQGVFGTMPHELSMGMSHDLEVAIEEGATIVRVGTAIFGKR